MFVSSNTKFRQTHKTYSIVVSLFNLHISAIWLQDSEHAVSNVVLNSTFHKRFFAEPVLVPPSAQKYHTFLETFFRGSSRMFPYLWFRGYGFSTTQLKYTEDQTSGIGGGRRMHVAASHVGRERNPRTWLSSDSPPTEFFYAWTPGGATYAAPPPPAQQHCRRPTAKRQAFQITFDGA
jgi:hypothetical protein